MISSKTRIAGLKVGLSLFSFKDFPDFRNPENLMSMSAFRSATDGTSQLARGFFTGLFVLAMVIVGLYLYQNKWEDIGKQLPIIYELSDTYRSGLEAMGGISARALQRFYELDTSTDIFNERQDGRIGLRSTWKREAIADKLEKAGFSKGRLRAAGQFLDYIEANKEAALWEMHEHKVPASIKLAQALLESSAGRSQLARKTNNHFGIKARPSARAREKINSRRNHELRDEDFLFISPAVGVFNFHDDHSYDRFETYRSVRDSYARHTQLLTRPCTPGHKGCYSWIWTAFPVGRDHDITEAARTFQRASGIAPQEFFNGQTTVPYYAACAAGLKMAGYATSKTYHQKLWYLIDTYELWRLDLALLKGMEG